jgi:hypothetical protein
VFGTRRRAEGPRLSDLQLMTSSEGSSLPRLWGTARLAGQVIWALPIEEEATVERQGGIKGGLGGGAETTRYSYHASFAVALCEGPVTRIGRVWADGKPFDLTTTQWRLHPGSEDQSPDSLILAHAGGAGAPAYRGVAYVVFERLALAQFGNRLPQLSCEIVRVHGSFAETIRSVNLIPGATEFGYEPARVLRQAGWGENETENAHLASGVSDWSASLDQLQAEASKLAHVNLVVAWYGNDLAAGRCKVMPGVERRNKETKPWPWQVNGLDRAEAHLISRVDGRPAYGGTPSDLSVSHALADLRKRNLAVTFYPFLLMDIPPGGAQPAYPWRGRIFAQSADDVAAFFDNGYRRMILHYAKLCAAAGGVESFLIGSELRGLTTSSTGRGIYPAVAALARLAGDVAAILPDAKISYAADWSEYFGHHPDDGSGDHRFHLDPLWAAPAIHYVGIDCYMPLSDWRDGEDHADSDRGAITAPSYLAGNVAGGEGFDWYYRNEAERESQIRTPITDGAHGKPWVFRYKDLKSWWREPHYDRIGGVESAVPTAWVPASKPIRLTEVGCPAVDKGSNQPNLFIDAKSAESALPHFSSGLRDDFIQRQAIGAILDHWSSGPEANPMSPLYGGPMVERSRISLWAYDVRPFPAFPGLAAVWADGANYRRGHWLNGRLAPVALEDLVASIVSDAGIADYDVSGLSGLVEGFVIDRPMAPRDALEQLAMVFAFDAVESGERLVFRHRAASDEAAPMTVDELVETSADQPLMALTRAAAPELFQAVRLGHMEPEADYRHAVVEARRPLEDAARELTIETGCVMRQETLGACAAILLAESWAARETVRLTLPPSWLKVEPGDRLTLAIGGASRSFRITETSGLLQRSLEARSHDPAIYGAVAAPARPPRADPAAVLGPPAVLVLDLPAASSPSEVKAPLVAAAAKPWPQALVVLSDPGGGAYRTESVLTRPAVMGTTLDPLDAGPLWRTDPAAMLRVRLIAGTLQSVPRAALLGGANAAAIGTPEDGFEIVQFASAELTGPDIYALEDLIRGQGGSEPEMLPSRPAGQRFVLLDGNVVPLKPAADPIGRPVTLRVGPAGRDAADPAFVDVAAVSRGLFLRPLAPVHPRWRRDGETLLLRWIRRTRIGGDAWEGAEVPLGEERERYELTLQQGERIFTLAVDAPAAAISGPQQRSAFGDVLKGPARLTVAQLSAVYGRGAALETVIDVK